LPDIIEAVRAGLAPHYTVEREIGAGGMARVFLAAERQPPRQVAIKVMNPAFSSPAFRARFTREIELTRGLKHAHIVPILAAQECLFVPDSPDDLCYYVMPYVEGESLRQCLVREKRLPLAEALRITREVGDALQYAHARQIIHRDIKPENILLDGPRALLTDFGVARAISVAQEEQTLTRAGDRVGSVAYMSPEQLAGERDLDVRADVYGLTCVVHEMLTGAPPLLRLAGGVRRPAVRQALLEQGVGLAEARELEAVVSRGLEADPDERIPSVEELMAELDRALRPSLGSRIAALLEPVLGRARGRRR
jgi:eukaryotic-like serine/threonine-protein kinase